ncbi:Start control protein cdc10 [Taphrina deformans PYCC 5710]|uniref:Start control protein cdc10 n=1 Tax=Taphrina deformans (strain PYCC 5710 / ATCC 11124 / CBS 356.35 / IMI 108563 / JCM 9778 / NBRC 8474) TaxID=1097556 RepID=R4XHB9_TAPDE|nr:Start control protein cdc10 [Taphrina deformans PYCC 5710]|eukprot:CCG82807.1 Start control protein cdc10 [Taphrina deformans PYCC 5710]
MDVAREHINAEVFTAVYSGVPVLEMTCRGVSVMRRIQKGNRTKILEREVLTGPHEKVQGGYGKYQGTWVSYEIGIALCERHSVRDILTPLLELDTASAPAMHATPTKEQHQASVRRHQHQMQAASERTDSAGLARGAAVYDPVHMQQPRGSSAALLASLQPARHLIRSQSATDQINVREMPAETLLSQSAISPDSNPSQQWNGSHAFTNGLTDGTPREPSVEQLETVSLPPLTPSSARDFDHSREVMTNIFLESDHGRVPGMLINSQLSNLDLDVPIDELGHSALHWAAALARLSLVETLILKGANSCRGNSVGETALMRAVMATNTMDQNCFLESLDALGPSLAIRDGAKRTVLHHIAITAGIRGRSAASRYYLTSLLEWIVKSDRHVTMDIGTFGSTLVDAQDRNGDTALNIAARIGNRGIVQSLLEVNADPYLPNNAGIRAVDSGTVDERVYKMPGDLHDSSQTKKVLWNKPAVTKASSEVINEMSSMIDSLQRDFEQEMSVKCKAVEDVNAKLREANKTLADLRRQVEQSKQHMQKLDEIGQRIRNTNHAIRTETKEFNETQMGRAPPQFGEVLDADAPFIIDRQTPPSAQIIKARIRAYKQDINTLDILAVQLNDKSMAMEARCRKLVSICTNSPLDQVDDTLPALLAALQSDGDPREFDLNEANRVAGFLKILS